MRNGVLDEILVYLGFDHLRHVRAQMFADLAKGARRSDKDQLLDGFCSELGLEELSEVVREVSLGLSMKVCLFVRAAPHALIVRTEGATRWSRFEGMISGKPMFPFTNQAQVGELGVSIVAK